ncbi:DUF456 domain-containing protein [Halomarina halobia]|uniref:DUF456 domain-containing protein n=1 Tax=Halomarina halobia TaxID=3033386 RepID=A0ABD6A5A1_9EURY|nr:DUF456 domain-containing protein [Halomarina sp. PSR21]
MSEAVALAAFALLVLGVVGTVVPLLPGALLSLAGVYLYWWGTGYAAPGPAVLAALTLVGVAAVAVDYFGGAIAARSGGASWWTTALAATAGVLLMLVSGPFGLLVGVAGTVFVLEYGRHRDAREGAWTALYATVGVLASAVVQALLALSMLVAMLAVALL